MSDYAIESNDAPLEEDVAAIDRFLHQYNERTAPKSGYRKLNLIARDATGAVVGGLRGESYWEWLFVDVLALSDTVRGQGIGSRLLARAEQEALARGCHSIYLDTFSFQALPFYQKQGYKVFGSLDNFPGEHKRYFLKKSLLPPQNPEE